MSGFENLCPGCATLLDRVNALEKFVRLEVRELAAQIRHVNGGHLNETRNLRDDVEALADVLADVLAGRIRCGRPHEQAPDYDKLFGKDVSYLTLLEKA